MGLRMIHTEKLTRTFTAKKGKTVEAVKGIDIDVAEGELVAFLGPNGAGKSTTLRMLTTLLPPTSGSASVAGRSIVTDPAGVRSRIGYVGQGSSAGHQFRVHDEMMAQGRYYGMSSAAAATRMKELVTTLDLGGLELRRVSTLSGGQRRRLDVAMGLMHSPELLFLDEPSTGMDPQNRANLWEHIARLRSEHNTTIVLTTHYLEEADAQAERVLVIDHGEIIADDTAPALKARLAGDLISVAVAPGAVDSAVRLMADTGDEIATRPAGPEVVVSGRFDGGTRALPPLLRRLDQEGIEVLEADVRVPTLDDVFLSLTGRSLREGENNEDAPVVEGRAA
ncbi:ATP-binding cassette domain-containing protein [Microlunatus ginsengisoli]|uniref:ATP-binding cassette domain-containing protein n=2 Tax=Microlunatus ginsengisoli TaxID=363863 RepID=A0ABP7AD41_9ACTN